MLRLLQITILKWRFHMLKRLLGIPSSRHVDGSPYSTSRTHRAPSTPVESSTKRAASAAIPASSSSSYPPSGTGPLKVKVISDAEFQNEIAKTLAGIENESVDAAGVKENAVGIAFLFVNLGFIYVDGELEQERMINELASFFASDEVSKLFQYEIITPEDVKIHFKRGGCEALLKFIDAHPEIQYCQFPRDAVAQFIRSKVSGEFEDFLMKLHHRTLLRI